MNVRTLIPGLLMAGTVVVGGVATAAPAWAAAPGTTDVAAACQLRADTPKWNPQTRRLSGVGSRSGCSNTVTYFWVRVYKVIDWWPDSEKAVKGSNYVQNGSLTAVGGCDGRGQHYTHTSTATGVSGDSRESGRKSLC